MTRQVPADILEALRRGRRFLAVLHENPDGDSLGTTFGLALALESLGKEVVVAGGDTLPPAYAFLPGSDRLRGPAEVTGPFDTAILPDCAALDRTGAVLPAVQACPVVLNIDHHGSNDGFGTHTWVAPEASAAGELAYHLVLALGAKLTPAVAICLYTAIVTDTGSFHYESTTPECLEIAAALVRAGASPWLVAGRLYETRSESSLRLLARALNTLEVSPRGKVAWVSLTPGDFVSAGAPESESDGIVNYPRQIDGVEVALFFRVLGPDQVRVGFRSRGRVDVAALAARFGGGGHTKAAGCVAAGGLGAVKAKVLQVALEAAGE
ncbi:MAG: DHH family phosphoesterase [Bacillota bacterium]